MPKELTPEQIQRQREYHKQYNERKKLERQQAKEAAAKKAKEPVGPQKWDVQVVDIHGRSAIYHIDTGT